MLLRLEDGAVIELVGGKYEVFSRETAKACLVAGAFKFTGRRVVTCRANASSAAKTPTKLAMNGGARGLRGCAAYGRAFDCSDVR